MNRTIKWILVFFVLTFPVKIYFEGSPLVTPCLISSAYAADINELRRMAFKYYERGAYDKALKHFVKILRSDPNNAEAREYMLRCSQKIVETKLGTQAADTLEQEIDVQKQIQEEVIPNISTHTPVFAIEKEVSDEKPDGDELTYQGKAIDIKELGLGPPQPSNARSLLEQRNALTDEFRRRYLGKGKVVDLQEKGNRLEITFYMNRLFLPFSDTLRREAYPILDNVLAKIQEYQHGRVTMRAVDNISPAVRHTMADLPSRRCTVIYSYLLYSSYLPGESS